MNEDTVQNESNRSHRLVRVIRFSSVLALLLATALVISLINRTPSVTAQKIAKPYDGLTIYRGLFFASGPVASKVPTVTKSAKYLPAEYKAMESQIITYIRTKDPAYFERFGQEMQSGDRVRVADAIKKTNLLQKEALLSLTKNSRTSFATQVQRLKDPEAVRRSSKAEPDEPENDANVAVEAVVWVALFVVVFIWLVAPKTATELKGLKFDQYVDEVVRAVPKAQLREAMP
jgi:SdpC family antimicrobial peptide